MNEIVGYIYFDRTREWESYFSEDPHWADDDEDWFLGGAVRTLDDVCTVLGNQGFDTDYIENFIRFDLSHDQYMELINGTKERETE